MVQRLIRGARAVARECSGARSAASDFRSFSRCAADFLLYRGLYFLDLPGKDRERTVELEGRRLTYRLNRGDIRTIREVWLDRCYRLPLDMPVDVLVDVGAHIGLTSLWYAARYRPSFILCVEPSPANARLARRNLRGNGVEAAILEAAAGAADGTAFFEDAPEATLGRLGRGGRRVAVMGMESILSRVPEGRSVDLLKLDVEGAEQEVLTGHLGWLDRVRSLIVEFHPALVDHVALVEILCAQGFRHLPAGSPHGNAMDFFTRG